MKRIAAITAIALASAPLLAQSNSKPSAAIRDSASREHRLVPTPIAVSQNEDTQPQEASALRGHTMRSDGGIPVGTAIRMKLEAPISTQENKAGDTFSARVSEPVLVGGKQVIPAGASVTGHIERTSEPRRIKGRPMIALRPESVLLPNGESIVLNATVVDTDNRKLSVDDEGRIKGSGLSRRDAVELTLGTGGGAAVGAIIAGTKGTLVGAGVGAAANTSMWLARRHSIELQAGTEIIIELNRPVQLQANSVQTGY